VTSSAQFAKHSSVTTEHYTPHKIVDAARALMGGIDLDPASCAQANTEIVRAPKIFTAADDGLRHVWEGRVWLNPPGGKQAGASLAKLFWAKLVDEYLAGRVTQACFLGFNLEMLQTTQIACKRSILSFPFCIPSRRIAFLYVDKTEPGLFGAPGSLKVGGGPTHANVVVWLPPTEGRDFDSVMILHFGWLGQCR
jgi:ParB family chromosome partitioning protein